MEQDNTHNTSQVQDQQHDTHQEPQPQPQPQFDEARLRAIVEDAISKHLANLSPSEPAPEPQDEGLSEDVLNILPERERKAVETALATMPRLAEEFAKMQSEFQTEREVHRVLRERKELREHEDAFRAFIEQDENRNKPVDLLADRFLLKLVREQQANPKPGVESGTPGSAAKRRQEGVYTAEEVAELRSKDPKRFMQLLAEGKIREIED